MFESDPEDIIIALLVCVLILLIALIAAVVVCPRPVVITEKSAILVVNAICKRVFESGLTNDEVITLIGTEEYELPSEADKYGGNIPEKKGGKKR